MVGIVRGLNDGKFSKAVFGVSSVEQINNALAFREFLWISKV